MLSITVIIPVYNRAHVFLETLDSVVCQTRLPERVIVVDDGSTDDIEEVFANWLEKQDPACPVELIHQENSGAAAARNMGIQLSPDAEWYAFVDSDDLWPPDFLTRCADALMASPTAIAVTCDRREVWSNPAKENLTDLSKLALDPSTWMFRFGSALLSGSLLSGPAVRKEGNFSTSLSSGQDLKLLLQLSQRGRWLHVSGRPYQYRHQLGQGAPQLHARFSDSHDRWARIFDDFYEQNRGSLAEKDPLFRKLLAKRWREAGDQHLQQGRIESAIETYNRGLALHRNFRTHWGLARARLSG